jgi:hypothetical protein
MKKFAESGATRRRLLTAFLWLLIAIYAAARILQIFPCRVVMLVVVALHVLPPLFFALIHGAMFYRVRGILGSWRSQWLSGACLSMWGSALDFRSVITISRI